MYDRGVGARTSMPVVATTIALLLLGCDGFGPAEIIVTSSNGGQASGGKDGGQSAGGGGAGTGGTTLLRLFHVGSWSELSRLSFIDGNQVRSLLSRF